MKEFELLKVVAEFFADEDVVVPATKHDAAYVAFGDKYLVFTCDTVNAVSDFPPFMKAEEYGHMALAVTLSDIAACGAKPLYFLSSISLREANEGLLRSILKGMKNLAKKYGVKIVGGDLDFSEVLCIAGFAVGEASKIVTRSGAKPGDRVYLTEITGKAELCLKMLKEGAKRDELPYASKLYTPEPRINEGLRVVEFASTMTDVSDSLAVSLHSIADYSNVKIVIDADELDLAELEEYVDKEEAIELFLYGGGDFELLFTAKQSDVGVEIGRVEKGKGVFVKVGGEVKKVEFKGYSHF